MLRHAYSDDHWLSKKLSGCGDAWPGNCAHAGKQPPGYAVSKPRGRSARKSAVVSLPTLHAYESYMACVAVYVLSVKLPLESSEPGAQPDPLGVAPLPVGPAAAPNKFSQKGIDPMLCIGVPAKAAFPSACAAAK